MSERPGSNIFEALNDECRRELLRRLVQKPDREHSVNDVIDYLVEETELSYSPEDLALHCYHHHLPKLDEVGLVSYDWDGGELAYVGDYPPEHLLELIEEHRNVC